MFRSISTRSLTGGYGGVHDPACPTLPYAAYNPSHNVDSQPVPRCLIVPATALLPGAHITCIYRVMSLEVGEHIPADYEAIFLDNLARHAKEGVLLSWARPNQGGASVS